MEREFDVIVVGAGGAGMTAAVAASRRHGLSTVVLESSPWFGGS
ncbi:MAG TPA: FAD-dependent oxidoreductase, partial [Aeromicrobium sp.]|nr:FAD-dependent oxidoreductase [Aeromicrobium sp.]